MTPGSPKQSPKNTNLGLLEYKVDELQKSNTRVEAKLDVTMDTLTRMQVVDPKEFDVYKQHVEDTYLPKASLKGWITFFKALGIAIGVSIATAVASFIINGGLGHRP